MTDMYTKRLFPSPSAFSTTPRSHYKVACPIPFPAAAGRPITTSLSRSPRKKSRHVKCKPYRKLNAPRNQDKPHIFRPLRRYIQHSRHTKRAQTQPGMRFLPRTDTTAARYVVPTTRPIAALPPLATPLTSTRARKESCPRSSFNTRVYNPSRSGAGHLERGERSMAGHLSRRRMMNRGQFRRSLDDRVFSGGEGRRRGHLHGLFVQNPDNLGGREEGGGREERGRRGKAVKLTLASV